MSEKSTTPSMDGETSSSDSLDHTPNVTPEVKSHEREMDNENDLAHRIIQRKVFETFYPMRDMQEEIDALSEPVRLAAIRQLHDARIHEIQDEIRSRVNDWEEWDAYGATLVETQNAGPLVDAMPETPEKEVGRIKEGAVAELDRDMDNLYAQVKRVKNSEAGSLEAPFEEKAMNEQTDAFVEKYGLNKEERERLVGDLAKEYEREDETEAIQPETIKTNEEKTPGNELKTWGEEPSRLDVVSQPGAASDQAQEPLMIESSPVRKAIEKGNVVVDGDERRAGAVRTGLLRLGMLLTRSKDFAGEKIGKSMNWIRDTVMDREGLTRKQIITRRVMGGAALLALAAGSAFVGYKFGEAGGNVDASVDNLPDVDVAPPSDTGVDEISGIEEIGGESAATLPDPDNFKNEHPWDWAVEAYGEGNAMSELHKLSDKAAEAGHTVEWHGSGTNEWVEIDGKSETVDVLRILRQYA